MYLAYMYYLSLRMLHSFIYNAATFSKCTVQIDVIQFSLPDAGVLEVTD